MDQTSSDFVGYLKLMEDIAREAASVVVSQPICSQRVVADLKRDVKVVADKQLHNLIARRLREEFSLPIFSEEGELRKDDFSSTGYCFIIDPLDGSLNFSRGIPINCISIGLWQGQQPIAGVVYDFNRKEMFSGLVGIGAWMNSTPIKIGSVHTIGSAILCTGFPVQSDFGETVLLDFVRKVQSFKKIRLLGSAALSLAYVAGGRADFYHEKDIAIWDVAAGLAIVKAAGGSVRTILSEKENRLIVTAANQVLLDLI